MEKYLNEDLNLKTITNEFNNKLSKFYFAHCDDKIVGFIKINFYGAQTEKGYTDSLELQRIYILKEYQGLKIGSRLM